MYVNGCHHGESMIKFEQAYRKVLDNISTLPAEPVNIIDAVGRTLNQSVKTERSVPPYHRVMMDGIAIQYRSWMKGRRSFVINGIQSAGEAPLTLEDKKEAIEVMTGAVLPAQADCVIPYEHCIIKNRTAVLDNELRMKRFQYVHRKGRDASKGRTVLRKKVWLKAPDIAVAASMGIAKLDVYRQPRITVLATGDELVVPGRNIKDHQVYLSNPYALAGAFKAFGFNQCSFIHSLDEKRTLSAHIRKALNTCDVLVMSGGISKGKYDYGRELLLKRNVREIFYCVKQRPGKPLWFGCSVHQQPIFALPGNPVSALVCAYQYVLPALFKMSGHSFKEMKAVCSADIKSPAPALTHFVPVKINKSGADCGVTPVQFSNSGDFLALVSSDGFVRMPAGQEGAKKGDLLNFIPWSPLCSSGR